MKQLECTIKITYRWWRKKGDIKPEHIEALKESAEERIAEMRAQGFLHGELHDNIRMTEKDGEDGVEYTGWWVTA